MAQSASKPKISLKSIVTHCLQKNKYVQTDFGAIVEWLVNVLEENMSPATGELTSNSLCDLTNDMLVANGITLSSDETLSVCEDIVNALIKYQYISELKEQYPINTECLGLYNNDQLYYPCKIKSVLNKNYKYLIEFSDYGNEQITYYDQLIQNSDNNKDGINNKDDSNNATDEANTNDDNDDKTTQLATPTSLLSSVKDQESILAKQQLASQIMNENNYQSKSKKKFVNKPIIEYQVKDKHKNKNKNNKNESKSNSKDSNENGDSNSNENENNNDANDTNEAFDEKMFENWDTWDSDENNNDENNGNNDNNNKKKDNGNKEDNSDNEDILLEGESIDSNDERWINRKNDNCELCDRKLPLTWHHLIPRMTHKKIIKLYNRNRDELNNHGIWVCRPCHSAIHGCYDNWTLAIDYNTLDLLKESNKIIKWLNYIMKKNKKLTAHQSDSRALHKMNRIAKLQQTNKKFSKNLKSKNKNKRKNKNNNNSQEDFDSTSIRYV